MSSQEFNIPRHPEIIPPKNKRKRMLEEAETGVEMINLEHKWKGIRNGEHNKELRNAGFDANENVHLRSLAKLCYDACTDERMPKALYKEIWNLLYKHIHKHVDLNDDLEEILPEKWKVIRKKKIRSENAELLKEKCDNDVREMSKAFGDERNRLLQIPRGIAVNMKWLSIGYPTSYDLNNVEGIFYQKKGEYSYIDIKEGLGQIQVTKNQRVSGEEHTFFLSNGMHFFLEYNASEWYKCKYTYTVEHREEKQTKNQTLTFTKSNPYNDGEALQRAYNPDEAPVREIIPISLDFGQMTIL